MEADYEGLDETLEEWEETADEEFLDNDQIEAIKQEIADLTAYRELAAGITENAKGKALIIALERAFAEAERLGAQQKTVIFTESRRTQEYLVRILSDSPWGDKLLLFNGSNTDQRSKAIYEAWAAKHEGTDPSRPR
jgi:ERCC4-related helicase